MANRGNSSIIGEMADKNPKLSSNVLLLHAKLSIYLGACALKSYILKPFENLFKYVEMFSKAS